MQFSRSHNFTRQIGKFVALFLSIGLLVLWGGLNQTLLSQEESDSQLEQISLLFVQTAGNGTFAPVEGETNLFDITLENLGATTGYFSDRPFRIAGFVPSNDFFNVFRFDTEVLFNAAFVLTNAENEAQDTIFTTINSAQYNEEENSVTFRVEVLDAMDNTNFQYLTLDQDADLPTEFEAASVFIDSFWDDFVDTVGGIVSGSALGKVNDYVCTTTAVTEAVAGEVPFSDPDNNAFDQICTEVEDRLNDR